MRSAKSASFVSSCVSACPLLPLPSLLTLLVVLKCRMTKKYDEVKMIRRIKRIRHHVEVFPLLVGVVATLRTMNVWLLYAQYKKEFSSVCLEVPMMAEMSHSQ